jgi:hypothetical protein
VLEDLEALVDEFDLQTLTHPRSPEQFVLSLVFLGLVLLTAYVAFRALARLF